ncbi:MAG: MmgE/PrpD family protein [Betaproteobacteria bacterium]|nr:MmgE/PrpD family protein [Betaproteobacteria bacterium]
MTAAHDYLDTISRFASETRLTDIPDGVRNRAKIIIADLLAVIAAGMQEPEMKALNALHLPTAGAGNASVIGCGKRSNPLDAALLNATAGVWLELDEGNFNTNGHPGVHVIPAALAFAQENGVSGADFLAAVILGYEICGRIGGAYQMKTIVQPHGTYGVIGAAIAVGRMSGFNPAQMRSAINIAASTPLGGNRQTMRDGATVRNYYAGHGNFTGQMAVRLVQAGFTGPVDAPSVTFGQLLADDFKPAQVIAGLGCEWTLAAGYIKLYPSGRYVHSAIDALLDALRLAPGGRLDAAAIERVDVRAYKMVAFLSEKEPKNLFGTRFSVPFSIATIIAHGRADLDVFGGAAFADKQVKELAKRVEVVEVPEFTAAFHAKQQVELEIVCKDGRRFSGRCEITKGEADNPHTAADIRKKFDQLALPVWGQANAGRVYDECMQLEVLPNLQKFCTGIDL